MQSLDEVRGKEAFIIHKMELLKVIDKFKQLYVKKNFLKMNFIYIV